MKIVATVVLFSLLLPMRDMTKGSWLAVGSIFTLILYAIWS